MPRLVRRVVGVGVLCLIAATSAWVPSAAADPDFPSLRLFAVKSEITASRPSRNSWVYLDPGVFVTPTGGTFEVRVSRPSYADPISVVQRSGSHDRALPADVADEWSGLANFLRITVRNSSGDVTVRRTETFCPNSFGLQRVSPDGAPNPTFPPYCGWHPFTLGAVWGIDDGWAVNPLQWGFSFRGADGHYTLRVSIARRYRDLFGVAAEDAAVDVGVSVVSNGGCGWGCDFGGYVDTPESWSKVHTSHLITHPNENELPDLVATPAWAVRARHRRGHDYLAFAATVWIGGSSRLDVQGFRRLDSDVMDAYQYFYRDSTLVGRAAVGTLEYDARRRHHHWHFTQFVRYRLVDSEKRKAVRSQKQSFCLAPTDAIDLTLPNAVRRPSVFGFFGACGSANSLWVRESLPVGWGDTYFQSIPGQSFEITNVPNGTYYIEVRANPGGRLYETDRSNDVSLRQVIIGGTPGNRTVCVPAFNGIDTEGDECPEGTS